jgi:hypothetical protein
VRLTLKIYNAAGELVAVVADGINVFAGIFGLGVSADAVVPDLPGEGASFSLLGTGLSLAWDGTNTQGQKVQSGSYVAVAEVLDQDGKTVTYSADVSVLRQPVEVQMSVYNSAGELVYLLRQPSATAPDLNGLAFSSDELVLGEDGQARLEIRYQHGLEKILWDGRNNQGDLVSAGMYIIKIEAFQSGLANLVVSRQVQVLHALPADPLAKAFAAPNPASRADARIVIFLGDMDPGVMVRAQFYSLSGERVGGSDNRGHANRLHWDLRGPQPVSPGIYFAVLETGGAAPQRKLIKLAIR